MYIADFLSRCGVKTQENLDPTMLETAHFVTESGMVHFSDERLEEFKYEIKSNEVLGKVVASIVK